MDPLQAHGGDMKRLAMIAVAAVVLASCGADEKPDYFTEESIWGLAGELLVFHDIPCKNPSSGSALVRSRNVTKGTAPEMYCYRIDWERGVAVVRKDETGEHVVDIPLRFIQQSER